MSIGFYDANALDFFARTVDADMADERTRFAARLPAGGTLLDAGCGSGRDARAFREAGFRVTALEPAPALAALARTYAGVPVHELTFQEISWRGAFDGVWACASLLHVPRDELAAAVRRLADALVPGGLIWMSFKYGDQDREPDRRRFTDLDEALARRLLADVEVLDLLQMEVSDDARADRIGERWLSLVCRRVG